MLQLLFKKSKTSKLVQEIHHAFYNAHHKPAEINEDILERGKRLTSLGFYNTEEAKIQRQYELDKEAYETSFYYAMKYPNCRFIKWKAIYDICEKYGLEHVSIDRYTGTIPEKNLREIENFKIREEDAWYNGIEWISKEEYDYIDDHARGLWSTGPAHAKEYSYSRNKMLRYGFSICAPKKDVSIPDPIVLHQVEDGYLIVTAWGEEASDERVVNNKMN